MRRVFSACANTTRGLSVCVAATTPAIAAMNLRRRIDRSPPETPEPIVGADQTQRQIAKHHGCAEDYA